MRRLQRLSGPALLAALALLGTAAPAAAQGEPKGKPVKFTTVDYVDLEGTFYPSPQAANSRTVLLLHAFGENSRKAEWVSLAKALNAKGYAVLAFDFRGHGESTRVQPGVPNVQKMLAVRGFWDEDANKFGVKGLQPNKPRPSEIEYKQFLPGYLKVLINDIAAARTFLDQMDAQGQCNSGDIIVIGAKEGAALGAVWINSEWHRFKYIPPAAGLKASLDLENPEGKAITCAVWLSIVPVTLNSPQEPQTINPGKTLELAGKVRKTPMAFFYGEGDDKGTKAAVAAEKLIKGNNKMDFPFTGAVKLPGAKGATGRELLSPVLKTEDEILTYLDNALKDEAVRKRLGAATDTYFWQVTVNGRLQQYAARQGGKEKIVFATYKYFIH
jgi:hypothetical protein